MKTLRTVLVAWLFVVLIASAQDKDKDKKVEKPAEKKEAMVIVKLVEDATLTIDGEEYDKKGETREFRTPPLVPGKKFFYILKAKWEPNNYTTITRTRKAIVTAGAKVIVDLREADPKMPDDIVIRYVPTPQAVVDKMMEMGKVTKADVVYDLGCGDGRLVVTAVSKFGAKKGVGIDIDAERIKDSNETAKKADVTDKVEFRKGDVMKIKDLEQASVVTLYLADELNEQLRPILQKRLKPGSRIVSHRFLMGEWKPEKTETVVVSGTSYKIHLWTVKGEEKPKEKDKDKGEEKPKEKDKDK